MVMDTEHTTTRLIDAGLDERAASSVAHIIAETTDRLASEVTVAQLRELIVEYKLDSDTKIGALEVRVGGLDARVGGLDVRVDGLQKQVTGLEKQVTGLAEQVTDLAKQVTDLDKKTDVNAAEAKTELHRALRTQAASILGGVAALAALIIAALQVSP